MSLSKNINAYIHTKPVLDKAVQYGGGVYTLISEKEAMRWRMQAYAFRTLLAKDGPTKYDHLVIRINFNQVVISVQAIKGKFETPDGMQIDIDRAMPEPHDPLLEMANKFALDLEIGDEDESK